MTVSGLCRILLPVLGLSATLAGPGRAAVIDFDAATPVLDASGPYVEDGFQFAAAGGSPNHFDIVTCSGLPPACGNYHIMFDNDGGLRNSSVRLSKVGGGAFDLIGFDVFRAETRIFTYSAPYMFTEPCAARCQVRSSTGGLADFVVGRMDFSAPEWRSVDWIEFLVPFNSTPANDITMVELDNIDVAPAPVPAPPALVLLATSLVSLIRIRRNRGMSSRPVERIS